MSETCDLQIHINAQHTFFLSEIILSNYSATLRKLIKHERRTTQIRSSGISLHAFPGGAAAFELVARFCYNNGTIPITADNVSLLHCCALFLGMSEKASRFNLLHQTEEFLRGIFHWSWNDVIHALKSCDPFFDYAESCGLIEKLMCSLLAKIAQNSDVNFLSISSSSSSSSPETGRSLSSPAASRKSWAWWFQDLTVLGPKTIEHFLRGLGSYGSENTNLVLTRFLLQYLKIALHSNGGHVSADYGGVADTAVHGVVVVGRSAFSCRGLFWVLKLVSGFGISRERRAGVERLIGGMLDQAKLDDLLVCGGGNGNGNGGVYDVNFVVRLIRLFVHHCDKMCLDKMRRVGHLIDMYLGEIGPDPNLNITKFLGVAESLPDCARDSFHQVYRAIDVYLQAHPSLSLEERSRLCRCLNYEKLSLEACKDLAKNPRIPPRIAVQALASQRSNALRAEPVCGGSGNTKCTADGKNYQMVLYKNDESNHDCETESSGEDKEEMKTNLERMQWRVVELEKVCREMKGQMARMVKLAPQHNRPLPRLC